MIKNTKPNEYGSCAETGIEKWAISINKMTCTYYDKAENEILVENIPE